MSKLEAAIAVPSGEMAMIRESGMSMRRCSMRRRGSGVCAVLVRTDVVMIEAHAANTITSRSTEVIEASP
jgi:hypothetical protein